MKYRVRAIASEWLHVDRGHYVDVKYAIETSWLGWFWNRGRDTFDTDTDAWKHVAELEAAKMRADRFNAVRQRVSEEGKG